MLTSDFLHAGDLVVATGYIRQVGGALYFFPRHAGYWDGFLSTYELPSEFASGGLRARNISNRAQWVDLVDIEGTWIDGVLDIDQVARSPLQNDERIFDLALIADPNRNDGQSFSGTPRSASEVEDELLRQRSLICKVVVELDGTDLVVLTLAGGENLRGEVVAAYQGSVAIVESRWSPDQIDSAIDLMAVSAGEEPFPFEIGVGPDFQRRVLAGTMIRSPRLNDVEAQLPVGFGSFVPWLTVTRRASKAVLANH